MLAGLLLGIGLPAVATSDAGGDRSDRPCRVDRDCGGYLRCLDRICALPPAVLGHSDLQTPTVELVRRDGGRARFFVELARDGSEQARGLSHRPSMADGWGMLFVYSETVRNAFTMALMRFPLDILFADEDGRILDIIEDAQPKTPILMPSGAYRYVLELNAGAVRARGIRVGDQLELDRIPGAHRSAGE